MKTTTSENFDGVFAKDFVDFPDRHACRSERLFPASYRDAKNGGLWRVGRSSDAEIAMDLRVWTADIFALQEKNKIFWKGIDKSARLW